MLFARAVAITPEHGADTLVHLASSPAAANLFGVYFRQAEHRGPFPRRAPELRCDGTPGGEEGPRRPRAITPRGAAFLVVGLVSLYPETLRRVQKSLARLELSRYS